MVAAMTVQHAHLHTYRLALIADAHTRAVQRRISKGEIDMAEITDLSETQIGILDKGMRYETFALTRAEAGKAAGNLKTRGLIKKTTIQGRWMMTNEGRDEHARIKAAKTAAADITHHGLEDSPINLADPALAAKDPVLSQFQALAAQRQIRINQLEKTVDDLNRLVDKHAAQIMTVQSQHVTTRINWYERVIAPLIDLMVQYDGEEMRLRVESDPGRIVTGITSLRHALDKVEAVADERAQIIEERDSKIESLNRCVEELEGKLKVWQQEYNAVKRHDLAVIILDDLCHLIPEVEAYRAGREDADRALEALKARR